MTPLLLAELGILVVNGVVKLGREQRHRRARRELLSMLAHGGEDDDPEDDLPYVLLLKVAAKLRRRRDPRARAALEAVEAAMVALRTQQPEEDGA